jgi:hypothetical protein
MLWKGCKCREKEIEKGKQKWDKAFVDKVKREKKI